MMRMVKKVEGDDVSDLLPLLRVLLLVCCLKGDVADYSANAPKPHVDDRDDQDASSSPP